MSVEFNEGDFYRNQEPRSEQTGWVTDFFIKIGLAKDNKSASTVMLVVALVCIGLAIFFFTR